MADRGNDLEKLKRQAGDLLSDLHARNLAIPAGILLVLIVAAMLVLPKSPTPPPPVQTAPTANDRKQQPQVAKAANISLVSATPLSSSPLTFGTNNPFAVKAGVNCRVVKASKPRVFECLIGSTLVTYRCLKSDSSGLCAIEGSTGGGGGSSGSTGDSGGSAPPGDGGGGSEETSTYYVVDVTYDGEKFKSMEAGEQLPDKGTALVFYAGPNSSGKKAIFVLGDGVSVQGATADPDLGSFEMSAGDEVVLTATDESIHTLKLSKITKVTR